MAEPLHRAARAPAGTTGFSAEERQIILRIALGRSNKGQELAEIHAEVLARIGVRDFSWPEFDRWQAFFTARRSFPPLWEDLKRIPPREATAQARQIYQERKVYLLLDWLIGLTIRLAQTRLTLARYEKHSIRAEITRQASESACPICATLDHREVKLESHDLPPFHPGCRCVVLVVPAASRYGKVAG